MGLLDIWNDWKKESGYGSSIEDIAKQSQYGEMNFSTQTQKKQDRDPRGFTGIGTRVTAEQMQKPSVVPSGYRDAIMSGGAGAQQGDIGFFQKLANMANVDFDKAAAPWKDKGGFEGLMANPAFTLGLAFMQAGANGQTIGQQSLDNILKAGAISTQYKSILESRKQAPIEATAADVAEVKDLLETLKIKEPNIWERGFSFLKGENAQANYDRAAEAIAVEMQKEIAAAQKANKSGKPLVIDSTFKEKIIRKLVKSGKIKEKEGFFGPFTAGTVSKKPVPREHGGPIKKGKAYVVGEAGPEVIIPKSDGNVLANDDSQIYAMLLAANPQLQKVSRQRAEKILRARFPEYFE